MAARTDSDGRPSVLSPSRARSPREAVDVAQLAGLLEKLTTLETDPDTEPTTYIVESLEAISQMRSALEAATDRLLRSSQGHIGGATRDVLRRVYAAR